MMEAGTSERIVDRLKALILLVEPQAVLVEKYGGLVAEADPGQTTSQFCGVFAYKSHVSLEFTDGAHLNDLDGLLEGNGKRRRHIKIASLGDIEAKKCKEFLHQARRLRS